ncbi:MAG: hypothetical protein WB817_09380 [Terriglobales bacterium]
MADTRELSMDDYLAMARRRLKVVVVPMLIAPIAGFLISYGFTPKYTSEAEVLVEGQRVPSTYVEPVVTADFAQRVDQLKGEMLSTAKLQPIIAGLDLAKPGEEAELIGDIRTNLVFSPAISSLSPTATAGLSGKKKPAGVDESLPAVNISYSDKSADRAQKICNAMAQAIITENLKSRSDIASQTTTFLSRQVDEAKQALDNQDAKLADFKKRYAGQLPGDLENNLRVLAALNTQLDATTQNLNRAQQDKTYAESMLSQQLAAWKNSQSSTSPETLEQQLTALQTQLLQLQARYTDDYPDVVKTKADIARVQARLDEINKAASSSNAATTEKATANEPADIRQLRLQIHQYQQVIDQSTSDQKKLQSSINSYEARTSMSPEIEEQWKVLDRDSQAAQKFYNDLLAKKSQADLGENMENHQEGEQLIVGLSASHPDRPEFPNRLIFSAAGLGAGLGLGCLLAIWLEFSDKSIRTERDAAVAMDLPLLISVPWVGEEPQFGPDGNGHGNGKRHFWGRSPAHNDEVKV